MKKYKLSQKANKNKQVDTSDIIDEVNAVSATDLTGLIQAAPKNEYEEEAYEEIFPEGLPN